MAQVKMTTARTTEQEPGAAAEDLMKQLGGITPKLVMLFASRSRDQSALNRAVPDKLSSMVMDCVQFHANRRPPDMAAVLDVLNAL